MRLDFGKYFLFLYLGGYFQWNHAWMCLLDLENPTFSIPICCQICHPSVYHFWRLKCPILTKLGVFYDNLPKLHPIYVIWAHSSRWNPPIAIPNFAKKVPQKAGTYIRLPCQCENPPGFCMFCVSLCFYYVFGLFFYSLPAHVKNTFFFFIEMMEWLKVEDAEKVCLRDAPTPTWKIAIFKLIFGQLICFCNCFFTNDCET